MDLPDMDQERICRICLQLSQDEPLLPADAEFCAQIKRCTGLQITELESWPNKMCTSCALLYRAAIKLRALCERAEQQLQQFLEKNKPEVPQELPEVLPANQECNESENSQCQPEYLEILDFDYTSSNNDTGADDESASVTSVAVKAEVASTRPAVKQRSKKTSKIATKTYVCNICSNVYTEKVKLTAHMKVHSGHKPHECEICHKRFRQTPQLARHMNSHTGLRPYKCDFCDSSFADPSTRIKHQRIHTNERPYKCQFCSKAFAYSNVLNVHLKIHTGERPFSCQYCGRLFSQLHHKNAHERGHNTDKKSVNRITIET